MLQVIRYFDSLGRNYPPIGSPMAKGFYFGNVIQNKKKFVFKKFFQKSPLGQSGKSIVKGGLNNHIDAQFAEYLATRGKIVYQLAFT